MRSRLLCVFAGNLRMFTPLWLYFSMRIFSFFHNLAIFLFIGNCNFYRDKQIGLPLRGRPILLSLVWWQTELDSTQFYFHYIFLPWCLPLSRDLEHSFSQYDLLAGTTHIFVRLSLFLLVLTFRIMPVLVLVLVSVLMLVLVLVLMREHVHRARACAPACARVW